MLELLFFELVQVAIGRKECLSKPPSDSEWEYLYDMAVKQALVGVCSVALEKLKIHNQIPPKTLLLKWIGTTIQIQQQNERINCQCLELQRKLLNDGFRSSILKGQGIALYYNKELILSRQPGDIDVWVDASKEVLIDYVMRNKPNQTFDAKHIHYGYFPDTEVEMHWLPTISYIPSVNKRMSAFYNRQKMVQMQNSILLNTKKESIVTPTASFNAVFLLYHIYGHFLYEGIGLRQIMDLYFVILRLEDEKNGILSGWKDFGVGKFAASVMFVLQKVFDMPDDKLLCEPNKKGGDILLSEILRGGNFGLYSKENQIGNETLFNHLKRRIIHRLRLFRYDAVGLFWRPLYRIRLERWKRHVLKKYNYLFSVK